MPFEKEHTGECERGGYRALLAACLCILLALLAATLALRCYRAEATALLWEVIEERAIAAFLGLEETH